MFLVDDLLLAPIKGVFWVFREIHDAARQEQASEGEAITAALSELYMRLETGQITEAEFDAQEKILLDRLDRVHGQKTRARQPKEKSAKGTRDKSLAPTAKKNPSKTQSQRRKNRGRKGGGSGREKS